MSSVKPVVVLLSLSEHSYWEESNVEQIGKLSESFSIMHVRKIEEVHNCIAIYKPQAIIMTDPILASPMVRDHVSCKEVVDYVQNGGRAIMAGYWSSFVTREDIDTWFQITWELPWQHGDYSRLTVNLNQQFSHFQPDSVALPASYSQKAVYLRNVKSEDGLYWPSDEFGEEQSQCPVAFTKIGKGYLGYIGDVNSEQGSQAVLLAMSMTHESA